MRVPNTRGLDNGRQARPRLLVSKPSKRGAPRVHLGDRFGGQLRRDIPRVTATRSHRPRVRCVRAHLVLGSVFATSLAV